MDNNGASINLTAENCSSFKYKSNFIGETVADEANRKKEGVKVVVPLKYSSNFWRYLINCKVEFSLKWYNNCILSSSGTAATFTITDTKLYVPVVTLKTKANTKLSKLLSKGFKWPIYLNEYKVIPNKNYNANEHVREILGASIQGVNWFFFFFLLILAVMVIILLKKTLIKNIFFQDLKLKITI